MRKRIGAFLLGVFAAGSISVAIAQTVVPCPPYCDPKQLEAEYGESWHLWYAIFGCWAISPPCGASSNLAGLPKAAITQSMLRMR